MRAIRRLDSFLANQIAAGEVIERPASVLKELIENSLDAGATKIDVLVDGGGIKRIQVTDNGGGIPADELPLALDRHATSKIYDLDELEAIGSLGFRGEALASIGAVSRLRLSSRTEESEHANEIRCEGRDSVLTELPAAHPVGTTLQIDDLFFNTPGRRRFLRSENTEFEHVLLAFKRQALGNFDCAFSLTTNGREWCRLPVATTEAQQRQRIAKLCGKSFSDKAMLIEGEAVGLRLWGWLGHPDSARSQADTQYFFVNQRIVRDRLINHAIRQAYTDLLYPGKQPAYVLYFSIDPSNVDVNVHPTKHEVRFHESRLVHDFIFRQIQSTLAQEEKAVEIEPAESSDSVPSQTEIQYQTTSGFSSKGRVEEPRRQYVTDLPDEHFVPKTLIKPPLAQKIHAVFEKDSAIGFRYLGLIKGRYLVAESPSGLLMMDVQQGYQQLTLLEWHHQLETHDRIPSQNLLVPETVPLSEESIENFLQEKNKLEKLGWSIDRLSSTEIVVRAVPSQLRRVDLEACVQAFSKDVKQPSGVLLPLIVSHLIPCDEQLKRRGLENLLQQFSERRWQAGIRELSPQLLDRMINVE